VYQRRNHVINLFIWRGDSGADFSMRVRTQQSYHLVSWTGGGLTYWAVSSVSGDELLQFARLVRDTLR
jgi:anti-sigma factor RsiW